jgi:hypothetical protein
LIQYIQQRLIIFELHYIEPHFFQVLIVTVGVSALAIPLAIPFAICPVLPLPLHGWKECVEN